MHCCVRLSILGSLLAACSDGGSPSAGTPVPASVASASGSDQVAAAGTALPESMAVLVRAADGTPLQNVTVVWSVASGGGSVSPATSATASNGIARARRTLGPNAGPQTASAAVTGLPAVPFSAIALIQGAMTIGSRSIGPAADTVLGTLVELGEQPPRVLVLNHLGVPVPGVTVTWAASGGGSVAAGTGLTDAGGESFMEYTFGAEARGGYGASATVTGLVGSPVLFTLNAAPGNPVELLKSGGDGLVVQAGGQVVHAVTTRDSYGNGAHGVTIDWAIGSGGGSISDVQNFTGMGGRAEVTRTLGTALGEQTVTATAAALPGAPAVEFTTTAAKTVVRVGNNVFVPSAVTIQAGDSVAWQWQAVTAAHNITFAATAGAPANAPDRTTGVVWRTFTTAGSFSYQCTNHVGMTGTVTVGP